MVDEIEDRSLKTNANILELVEKHLIVFAKYYKKNAFFFQFKPQTFVFKCKNIAKNHVKINKNKAV